MIVEIKFEKQYKNSITVIEYKFTLERDDFLENSEKNIKLTTNNARFYFPLLFDLPHNDLIALSVLKIISPYIGNNLKIVNFPVSPEMGNAIKKAYPNIKHINIDPSIKQRKADKSRAIISFSGGVDSVAAASLLPKSFPLVLQARKFHPEIGKFEHWYNTEANIQTINYMDNIHKHVVFTDVEFLSIRLGSNYCVVPDTYAFTIPSILLADYYNSSYIIVGDIWVAYTGDETIANKNLFYRRNYLFEAADLKIETPVNGIGELGTMIIAKEKGLLNISTTCQYGKFNNPCRKCIKCFRKKMYAVALFNEELTDEEVDLFDNSPSVQNYINNSKRYGYHFLPSYAWVIKRKWEMLKKFDSNTLHLLKLKTEKIDIDVNFANKLYQPIYYMERPYFIHKAYEELLRYIAPMNNYDVENFLNIDYKRWINE